MGMAQPVPLQQAFQAAPALIAQALPVQQAPQRCGLLLVMSLSLVIIALVIIGGSGLIYYIAAGHPADLHTQATSVAQDFLTAQARSLSPQDIFTQATRGKPAINDPLNSANGSIWSGSGLGNDRCLFTNGAFHAQLSDKAFNIKCYANGTRLSNLAFQVQMTIASGMWGGLLIRADVAQTSFYAFTASIEGYYQFTAVTRAFQGTTLSFGPSPAMKTGLNQSNLLTVIARGDNMYLYINKQYIATVHDSTFTSGSIGLFGASSLTSSGDIAFNNAQVWKL